MRMLVLAGMLCMLGGCPLEQRSLEPLAPSVDPPRPDAGRDAGFGHADAGGARDAAADAAGVDASVPPPDAQVDAEAPLPDAGRLTCDERYGSVEGYLACPAAEDRCGFYAALTGRSCDQVCQDHGGQCLEVLDDAANGCADIGPVTCESTHNDAICFCSRP